MSERKQPADHAIEILVRAHLAQQQGTVDARRILDGVQARLAASAGPAPHAPRSRALRYSLRIGLAAVILAAVFWGLQVGHGQASATTLVQAAQKVHAQPVDRCYEIETQLEPTLMGTYRILPAQPRGRLWTRGDRFWIESLQGNRDWTMGRDEEGRVWFASARGAGFRFRADELPERLRIACELRSMRIDALLREMLADFDLREEDPPPGRFGVTRVIRATLKPDRRCTLQAVTIEIDRESKVLKRVALSRTHLGGAASTVTFTLVAEGHQNEDVYRLEGHVDSEASIDLPEELPYRLQRLLESARP